MVYLFAIPESERAELRHSLAKFARSYYDSLTVVTASPLHFPDLPPKLGLDPDPAAFPQGAVHQISKDRVYPYPKGRSIESRELQQWGLDVFQGRILPWTPPSVTTTYEDLLPVKAAKPTMSLAPGLGIKIAGYDHDEL